MAPDERKSIGSAFTHYPHLTRAEFSEVAHHLDRRYRKATLGPLRKKWKLTVCTAFDSYFIADADYSTFVQITRPLQPPADQDDLASKLGDLSVHSQSLPSSQDTEMGTWSQQDQAMFDVEESDAELLHRLPDESAAGYVTYEIHLHPTYQVPCLWFSLHALPAGEECFSVDTVFRRLVPEQYKSGLRKVGAVGGISADHHPVTGVPCFFVHPCLIGEAMASFDCSKENYLMTWLGQVGGTVGLWVPTEMAMLDI